MFQRGEHVLTMPVRQVRDARRKRADEVLDAFGRFPGRRRALQERFEGHADYVGRAPAEAS
jgi:hypothetical protein